MLGETEMWEIVFTFAEPAEEEAIRKLLMDADLPAEDFARHLQHFLVAKQGGTLVGVIGPDHPPLHLRDPGLQV